MPYDEFPDPVPIIRKWITENRRTDADAVNHQFYDIVDQAQRGIQPSAGLMAWLAIAFAAGREYGETKNARTSGATKTMWLTGGQFYCDAHRPHQCIPFFGAELDAVCAECSGNAPESYLSPPAKVAL